MSDNATAGSLPASADGSPYRPDYARSPRRRLWRSRAVRLCALVLVVGIVGFAAWAKGRGYKTSVFRVLFPNNPAYMEKPRVVAVRPAQRTSGVMPDVFIAADVHLPNTGRVIDKATLEGGVLLYKGSGRDKVPAVVNTSGGGDAIVLRPLQPLELNSLYVFEVLPALKDTGGAAFERFTSSFTTAAGTTYSDYPAAATKVEQPGTAGNWYTGLAFGPDGRLYASTLAGQVARFEVSPDGSLSKPEVFSTVPAANGGPRLMTGITFDPASTPENPVAYVVHGTFPFDRVPDGAPAHNRGGTPHGMSTKTFPDWGSKISRLSGRNLETYEDVVVGLPRARHDHMTGQIAFGPDGALYFAQASNTAMGAPDHEWGYRPERLLTACVMRLDPGRLAGRPAPLNVQTEDGHAYDPFAADAPLTIYATGSRNSYDLLWHSGGHLYATLNGSARGGNTPATPAGGRSHARRIDQHAAGPYAGPPVPGLQGVGTQNDFLLRVERGGYYGHPNPVRAEYVMNGGNPTAGPDLLEVGEYPAGTLPDRNWRPPTFDFGKNLSPCGLTEYTGDAFPALKGKILVVRFSGGKDIIALTPGDDGEVREFITGIDGFTQFHDPVDLCVSPETGFIYVAEHTGQRITLLRPTPDQVSKKVIRDVVTPPAKQAVSPLPMVRTEAE